MKEKIIKYAFYIKGFIKMSTMVILLIMLVTYYFYQDKIKEVAGQVIQNNRDSGTLFYVEGIWNRMKGVQKTQEDRNQNAFDLAGAKKIVNEKNGLYSFEMPENWTIGSQQGTVGAQISKTSVSGSTFSQHIDGTDIYYDNGAQLSVQVLKGEQADAKKTDGGHGKMLLSKNDVYISGEKVSYHKITDLRVKGGDIIDAHVLHGGNTYEIRFVYNNEKFNGGEFLFNEIMNSFQFK
jgi:hypothetical protein